MANQCRDAIGHLEANRDTETSDSSTCNSGRVDFPAALLRYHLDSGSAGKGLDETDFGQPSLLDLINNDLRLTIKRLEEALNCKQPTEDVNELHPSDRDAYGEVAVLHKLVTGHCTHKIDLVTTLMTFSNADIDLTTSRGKTAFHLAVELGNVELMQNLAALGADVNKSDNNLCTPYATALRMFGGRSVQREVTSQAKPLIRHAYLPTEEELYLSAWAIGFHRGRYDTFDSTLFVHSKPATCRTTRNLDMVALLEEVCAVPLGKKCTLRSCEHRDSIYTKGASNHASTHPIKKYRQQLTTKHGTSPQKQHKMQLDRCREVAAPFLSFAAGDVSPDQAVDIVKRLQESATERRRKGVRVLCLDGGGVRGLVQLEILRQIEEKLDAKINDLFDCIVGTSTGGIIALALVYGERTVRQLQQLYLQMKNAVFAKQSLFELGDTEKLEEYLTLWFDKDMTMDKKEHPKVLVSAVMRKTTHVQLHWFSNFLNDDNSRASLVWEVARRTSAAPFYFTPKDNYVDGGLLANNPSLHALTTIQTHLRSEGDSRGVSLVVSVGTGMNPAREYGNLQITNAVDYVFKNKQFLQFMGDVVGSHSVTCEASCHCMCEEQGIEYVRLDPSLATEVDPGETDNQKLLDMLWTTRKYLHQSEHLLNALKEFFARYARDSD